MPDQNTEKISAMGQTGYNVYYRIQVRLFIVVLGGALTTCFLAFRLLRRC